MLRETWNTVLKFIIITAVIIIYNLNTKNAAEESQKDEEATWRGKK